MSRVSRWLIASAVVLALVTASAGTLHAQAYCYQPVPVVAAPVTAYYAPAPVVRSYYAAPAPMVASYYAAPAPVVSYYAPAPVATSYYAPAAGVTTYRYGPLGRLRSVSSYYAPAPVVRYYGY
jgi:hypothetical protein